MKVLIDIGHPAHVHLFKNFILFLQNNNHTVITVSRDKDITVELLNYYNIKHIILSVASHSLIGMFKEFITRTYKIWRLHRKLKFDIAIGTSISIGYLSMMSTVKSYNFCEDDDSVIPLQATLSYPFSNYIINPVGIKYKIWSKKRILHASYHELAYLHPNHFTPNKEILKKYSLTSYEYIVIRKSALTAHHDINAKGLDQKIWNKINNLIKNYPQIHNKENEKNHKIESHDMHHILAFAKLVISDSQTMTAEAAVLGTPSIRYNTFVKKISYLEELEDKYKLTFGFFPGIDDEDMLEKIKTLLNNKNLHNDWQEKRKQMLCDKTNFNQWMINFLKIR